MFWLIWYHVIEHLNWVKNLGTKVNWEVQIMDKSLSTKVMYIENISLDVH